MNRVHTKKEFAAMLGISYSTLKRRLNKKNFMELCQIGYEKRERILKPKVCEWLCRHLDVKI